MKVNISKIKVLILRFFAEKKKNMPIIRCTSEELIFQRFYNNNPAKNQSTSILLVSTCTVKVVNLENTSIYFHRTSTCTVQVNTCTVQVNTSTVQVNTCTVQVNTSTVKVDLSKFEVAEYFEFTYIYLYRESKSELLHRLLSRYK